MSNQIVNNKNRINKNNDIKNEEASINKKTQVNSLVQRIANGESGVVLEEILWKIMVERSSGLNWKSSNQTLKKLIKMIILFVKGCHLATLSRSML